jgi:hypothetical protein
MAAGLPRLGSMSDSRHRLGEAAVFLLPSLKLKKRVGGAPIEEKVHRFLVETFGGYTAAAGSIFGYWVDEQGQHSYGEHRQFLVAVDGGEKTARLTRFLAEIGRELEEESIFLAIGNVVYLVGAAINS